jgi:hypothetical protein
MTLASRLNDLVDALITALNGRSGLIGPSTYDLYVQGGGTKTQAVWLRDQQVKGARAHGSAVQALSAGNPIVIDALDYNDDATLFTVATNGITVLTDGLYSLHWEIAAVFPSPGTLSAYLTGSNVGNLGATSDSTAVANAERNGSSLMRLPAGTKVSLLPYNSTAGSTTNIGPGSNYLSITRLSG